MKKISIDQLKMKILIHEAEINSVTRAFKSEKIAQGWTTHRNKLRSISEIETLDKLSRNYVRGLMAEGKIVFDNTPGERKMFIERLQKLP